MNIVQINYACDADLTDPEGLLARYATLTGWSDALTRAGATVRVLQRFPRRLKIVRDGVEYVFAPSPNQRIAGLTDQPAIAHVNGLVFSRDTWWLRRVLPASAAIVIQDHGSVAPTRGGLLRALNRRWRRTGLSAADAFMFAAAAQVDPWRSAGLIDRRQRVYEVMPASTSFEPVPRDAARRQTGLRGAPALLWVGRLNANKDPMTVLNGFDRCLPVLADATLTMIYSEDQLLDEVRARIDASAGLKARVRLVGPVEHEALPAFYSAADVFVVGSHHEGSGYALIEACACGLPSLVTDIPSFRAITNGGACGALWTPGDPAGFAHTLTALGRLDLESMRRDVRCHFERTWSWRAIAARAMDIYGELAERRRSAVAA